MHLRLRLLALFALGLLPAAAQVVTLEISGVLKSFSSLAIRNAIGVGSTFTATATFDSAASATSNNGTQSIYPLVGLTLTVNGVGPMGTWTASSNSASRNISVVNDTYYDEIQFSAVGVSSPTFSGFTADTFNITFYGGNHLLSSMAVPTSPSAYDPAVWDPYQLASQTQLKIYYNSFATNAVFQITSVGTPSAIPEPSTYAAICGGLALAGVMLRRRLAGTGTP